MLSFSWRGKIQERKTDKRDRYLSVCLSCSSTSPLFFSGQRVYLLKEKNRNGGRSRE
jgi:hypothetical protein